ncbi:hypothetical protein [Aliarcobacter butzleri]|uniref:hypothetical protein n=1 Tax=Aliarcobacter butzleri TaxID=28197 RepID=UPI00126A0A4C|nr:hypothetical protein [Aliarcobacter butzleri]
MNKFEKIANRFNKPTYKHLTKDEATYHKALVEKDRLNKELYGVRGIYATLPKKNGAINWEAASNEDLELFEIINKRVEKINKKISKFEDKYNFDEMDIRHKFNISQNSLSSSFAS